MDSITVTLPPALEAFVDIQLAERRHAGAEDYILHLVREDARRNAREQLDAMLRDGLATHETPWVEGDIAQIRDIGRAA